MRILAQRIGGLALLLVILVGASSLSGGELKNPGFEESGGWEIVTSGGALEPAIEEGSFSVSLPDATQTSDGEFAGVVQTLELTGADQGISFRVKDNYTGETANYHWMELLLDDEVIWEADVAGGETDWRTVRLDLARYLAEPKRKRIGRHEFREDRSYRFTFRLIDRKGVNRFGIQVWADDFQLLAESPDQPQNCERKTAPPKIRELLFFFDEADRVQPITRPEHFAIKRRQILEGMLEAMGDLPERPVRSTLEEFHIRERNSQVRGRYTRKIITLAAAEGEEIHAYLYEPLNREPGEKRPGIVGMHPTGEHGKGSFESWPLCNFPIELAMMGYVVIVPDYPGFGDARPYDFEADRYDSGTIKGVFNHMVCVDLLQRHPAVDPDKIGTIGHSLGGHNAMFLAAFDERVKIAVSSCGWTPFEYYETKEGRLKTWALPRYMPRLETIYQSDHERFPFDFHEVAAAISPRVFFSSSPTGDGVFPGWGPKAGAAPIREYYQAQEAGPAFQFHQPRAQHRFPWDTRQAAYRSMNDVFDYHPYGTLGLLAERKGEAAVATLKGKLGDPDPAVRLAAADLLGGLGDRSGLDAMRRDLAVFSAAKKDREHALEIARVLAESGDPGGGRLATDLALGGTTAGQRWRAAVVLAHLANLDRDDLVDPDPVAVLKTLAAEETDEGVFFVLVDQLHKILKDRSIMIDILAIAKDSRHHSEPPPGHRNTIAEIFHEVAVRDRNKTWR